MDKYLEIFDVLYEIKEQISDKNYLFLNTQIKELYQLAKINTNKNYKNYSDNYVYESIYLDNSSFSTSDGDTESDSFFHESDLIISSESEYNYGSPNLEQLTNTEEDSYVSSD